MTLAETLGNEKELDGRCTVQLLTPVLCERMICPLPSTGLQFTGGSLLGGSNRPNTDLETTCSLAICSSCWVSYAVLFLWFGGVVSLTGERCFSGALGCPAVPGESQRVLPKPSAFLALFPSYHPLLSSTHKAFGSSCFDLLPHGCPCRLSPFHTDVAAIVRTSSVCGTRQLVKSKPVSLRSFR